MNVLTFDDASLAPTTKSDFPFGVFVQSVTDAPTIASLTTSGPVSQGSTLTLTAGGVTVPTGSIKTVDFYTGTTSTFDAVTDRLLGQGTTTDGVNYFLVTNTTNIPVGTDYFFAKAVSALGEQSAVVSANTTINDHPPHITMLVSVPTDPAAGNTVLLQAVGVSDPLDPVQTVNFYWDQNLTGVPSTAVLLGTDTSVAGGWNTKVTLPDDFPSSGPATFLAQAVDGADTLSNVVSLTDTVNARPTISSFIGSPNPVGRNTNLTLTATAADSDGSVTRVGFWVDNVGDGVVHPLQDTLVGYGIKQTGTSNWTVTYRVPLDTVLTDGTATLAFLADAIDNQGAHSVTATTSVTVAHAPPTINKLILNPTIVNPDEPYSLTAAGIADADGKVASITFYFDPNNTGSVTGAGVVQLGQVINPGTSVTLDLTAPDTIATGSALQFLAQAVNENGQDSAVVTSASVPNARPTIGALIASPTTVDRTHILPLTAQTVADTDDTVTQVMFYRGVNGDTTLNRSVDQLIGVGTQTGPSTGIWTFKYLVPVNAVLGSDTFFAVAVNSHKSRSEVASVAVTIQDDPPVIGSLAVGTPHVAADNAIFLRAVAVKDFDGKVQTINFYWDPTGTGTTSGAVLLGADTAPSGWTLSATLPSSATFPTNGTATFVAQAEDNDGTFSTLAVTTVPVVAQPVVAGLETSPSPINHEQSALLTRHRRGRQRQPHHRDQGPVPGPPCRGSHGIGYSPPTGYWALGIHQSGGNWVLEINQSHNIPPADYVVFVPRPGQQRHLERPPSPWM